MTLTSQPLVSVITPVYNTEKYLIECIESVIAQTYQNWEYAIVNNSSTDRSLEIAQHYAQKDARIRIHNNTKFLNQMQNWNHAMHQMSPSSKYCKVVHADDWLFPECIARMVEVAEANLSVGIVGAYRLDEDRVNLDGLPYPSTFVPGMEICRWRLLGGRYVWGSPTSLLIRSDIIRSRKTFYNESNIHADQEVCFDILQDADFGLVHQVLTFTRRHNETTTTFLHMFNTYIIGDLIVLKKYGSVYLTSEEYERAFKRWYKRYYRSLAQSLWKSRKKEILDYHKKELRKLGQPLSHARLCTCVLINLYNSVLRYLRL